MNGLTSAIVEMEYRQEIKEQFASAAKLAHQYHKQGFLSMTLCPLTAEEMLAIVVKGEMKVFPALDAYVLSVGAVEAAKSLIKESHIGHDRSLCGKLR